MSSADTVTQKLSETGENRLVLIFGAAVAVSALMPLLPFGRQLLYPFALLSTWAHELGHGIAAVLVGGSFKRLELYSNLGGVAYTSGPRGLRRAFVSSAGLLGPAVAGGLIILAGSREKTAPLVLGALAVAIWISVVLVVRNLFGFASLVATGAVLTGLAGWGPEPAQLLVAQLVGIQFCFACWGSLDYMFTKHFIRDGQVMNSDTQNMAEELFLPYWFWGGCIAAVSASILAGSFYLAWVAV